MSWLTLPIILYSSGKYSGQITTTEYINKHDNKFPLTSIIVKDDSVSIVASDDMVPSTKLRFVFENSSTCRMYDSGYNDVGDRYYYDDITVYTFEKKIKSD